MRIVNLAQNSPDWLRWRDAGLGSSDAAVLMYGKHFGNTLLSLWKEKVVAVHGEKALPPIDRPKKRFQNAAMSRGKALEGEVRTWYEHFTGQKASPLCGFHDEIPFLKASLDGWFPDSKIVLEIKCPGRPDHSTALARQVPEKYLPQLLHLCLVSGGETVHYLSRGKEEEFPDPLDLYALVPWQTFKAGLEELLVREIRFWQEYVLPLIPPQVDSFPIWQYSLS